MTGVRKIVRLVLIDCELIFINDLLRAHIFAWSESERILSIHIAGSFLAVNLRGCSGFIDRHSA